MRGKTIAMRLSLLALGATLAYTAPNTATDTVTISVEGHAVYPDEDGNIEWVYKVIGDDSPIIAFQNYVEIPVTPDLESQYRIILDAIRGAFPHSGWYKIPSEIFDPFALGNYVIGFDTIGDPKRGLSQIVLTPIEEAIPPTIPKEKESEYVRLRKRIGLPVTDDSLLKVIERLESPPDDTIEQGLLPVITIIGGVDGQREATLNYEKPGAY